jgi:hypothetical protein
MASDEVEVTDEPYFKKVELCGNNNHPAITPISKLVPKKMIVVTDKASNLASQN